MSILHNKRNTKFDKEWGVLKSMTDINVYELAGIIRYSNKTAPYRIIMEHGGKRYAFFCEISGIAVYTKELYGDNTSEGSTADLEEAWTAEGRQHFNYCGKCNRWVCDVMFNADTSECVECSPWEETVNFCKYCGAPIHSPAGYCDCCGEKVLYTKEGVDMTTKTIKKIEVIKKENKELYGFGIDEMKKLKVCRICGTSNPESKHYCVNCGRRLPKENLYEQYKAQNASCPDCGMVIDKDSNFCPNCGNKLDSNNLFHGK